MIPGFADAVRNGTGHAPRAIDRYTIGELIAQYPTMHPPVVSGLFRARETINIISVSKIGKSWLAYSLGLSIITGRPWLGRYATHPGRVLLIDNELHRPTIASRIQTVARAMGIEPLDYYDALEVWPLRGDLRDIYGIRTDLETATEKGTYQAIIIDAKYRMLPAGASENDNAAETEFFNLLDAYAEMTGAAIINIHHSSKGSQSEKRVTDVGAGAGAQSRAADCHLVLREHEEDDVVVLDAAVRSFAPVHPLALRWAYPLWMPAEDVDPGQLKGRKPTDEEKGQRRDETAKQKIKADGSEVLGILDHRDPKKKGIKLTDLAARVSWGMARLVRACTALVDEEVCAWTIHKIKTGKGRPQEARGVRRAPIK